jgi:hypothetical protein
MSSIKKSEREIVGGLHCRRGSNGRHRQTYIRQENYVNEATMMARKKFNEENDAFYTSEIKLIDSRLFIIQKKTISNPPKLIVSCQSMTFLFFFVVVVVSSKAYAY